ncbi:FAD-dependent oxidoreductase [Vibrio vulnificus]|uniref:FAD-dependent oxidoreductase n=1 Tax=Vibrio vulnificus TaxID=672 RepID=UPI00405A22C5
MNNKSNTPPHIAILGAGISGLAAAHECIKKGYRVTVYDKLPFSGGKCIGAVHHGKVHELTHRQLFAKNIHLLSFLQEIPTENGTCFDFVYPQQKVQFHWGQSDTTMQFKRSYFSPIDKLIDDMKSAYAMHYAGVPLIDIYWFKTRLQNLPDSAELLKTPLERYFEYNQRPKLAAFLRPVLLGWIGATDHSPALSILDLLNNKEGPFHSDAPNAYSLGYRRPISESVINPLTEHLRQQSVQFRLGCEIERLIEDSEQGKITHVLSSQGEVIEADYFILALPIHVTQSLLSATAVQFSYRYVLSHGFQFHFATLPDILRDKTVGIVIDSPWGLSYHLTQPEPNGLYCLSVTATDLNIAAGTAFNKPLLACTPQQIEQEIVTQIFGNSALLTTFGYQGFHVGPGLYWKEKHADDATSNRFVGPTVIGENGVAHCWVADHALTHPDANCQIPIEIDSYQNVFLAGEYLTDPRQTWRVPVTMERCVETAKLAVESLEKRITVHRHEEPYHADA